MGDPPAAATFKSVNYQPILVDSSGVRLVRPIRGVSRGVARRLLEPAAVEVYNIAAQAGVAGEHFPGQRMAVRELLKRGLTAEGFELAPAGTKSQSFGVIEPSSDDGMTDTRRESRRDLAAD